MIVQSEVSSPAIFRTKAMTMIRKVLPGRFFSKLCGVNHGFQWGNHEFSMGIETSGQIFTFMLLLKCGCALRKAEIYTFVEKRARAIIK